MPNDHSADEKSVIQEPTSLVSTPGKEEVIKLVPNYHFGYYETIGRRSEQEDALAWTTLTPEDLTTNATKTRLTPTEIGHRLWTSYKLLDDDLRNQDAGTTASTTVYDGNGNLITATLGDAVSFAAIYGTQDEVLGVVRLNKKIHKIEIPDEKKRILRDGGTLTEDNVILSKDKNRGLTVARSIGDRPFKPGACSDASISITSIDDIYKDLRIDRSKVGALQIITTCDGFTDGAYYQEQNHTDYLSTCLSSVRAPGKLDQDVLANHLANMAIKHGSTDNISVAVQNIDSNTPPFFLGIYDGHGGNTASHHVAKNIVTVFKKQCSLEPEAYAEQPFSFNNHQENYDRDNRDINIDPLYYIVAKLISNIKYGEGGRKTTGATHPKIQELKSIQLKIKEKGIIKEPQVTEELAQEIMDVCKKKRHSISFLEPHSVGEFKELLRYEGIPIPKDKPIIQAKKM